MELKRCCANCSNLIDTVVCCKHNLTIALIPQYIGHYGLSTHLCCDDFSSVSYIQHTADEWYAMYGRLLVKHPMYFEGIQKRFRSGERSESLWTAMKEAVNNG